MSRKSDARFLVPLCAPFGHYRGNKFLGLNEGHHAEAHRGVKSFEAKHGVNLLDLAAKYEAAWRAHALTGETSNG